MRSKKQEPFVNPLAADQEEYNTLYFHVDLENPMVPMTVKFQFNPGEIAEIIKNNGHFYYTQNVMTKPVYNDKKEVIGIQPGMFNPMSISAFNPLEPASEDQHMKNWEKYEKGAGNED